ncbi:MAG: peptidoglycan-binding domain-containing protein [Bacteroidota bacterium]
MKIHATEPALRQADHWYHDDTASSRSMAPPTGLGLPPLTGPTIQRKPETMGPLSIPGMEAEEDTGLNPRKMAAAIAFYEANSARFTHNNIRDIQAELDLPQTAQMNEATIRAIADFQRSKRLRVDGQLDYKSLRALFPTGLARDENVQAFSDAYLELDLPPTATRVQKAQAILRLVNDQLQSIGVPRTSPELSDDIRSLGKFDSTTWTIKIHRGQLLSGPFGQREQKKLAATIYHEARHAEQYFNIARRMSAQRNDADNIAERMGFPIEVARAAANNPMHRSAEALVTERFYESISGSESAATQAIYERVENAAEEVDRTYAAAQRLANMNTSSSSEKREADQALEAAKDRHKEAMNVYKRLPMEHDAFKTEEAFTADLPKARARKKRRDREARR